MIELVPMTDLEYENYLERACHDYAKEKVAAGNWLEENALSLAKAEYHKLLPQGLETNDCYLYTVKDHEDSVGMIWLAKLSPSLGFIYDIYIEEKYQGKGLGKATMQAIENEAIRLGLQAIQLHVFGHNHKARQLYQSLEYKETNVKMVKVLMK